MITTLTWVSVIAGGILIVLLLLSLLGGLDLDMDVDFDSADVDADSSSGGLGIMKGALTFVSVSSWMMKIMLMSEQHIAMAAGIGIFAGIVAIVLLNYMLKLLLRNEENVNWAVTDALYQSGKVYLKIPQGGGNGIVQVDIKGATRELKALSRDKDEIKTGESVLVIDVEGEYAIVQKEIT